MEAVSHLELSGIFYHCSSSATAVSQAAVTVRTLPAGRTRVWSTPKPTPPLTLWPSSVRNMCAMRAISAAAVTMGIASHWAGRDKYKQVSNLSLVYSCTICYHARQAHQLMAPGSKQPCYPPHACHCKPWPAIHTHALVSYTVPYSDLLLVRGRRWRAAAARRVCLAAPTCPRWRAHWGAGCCRRLRMHPRPCRPPHTRRQAMRPQV